MTRFLKNGYVSFLIILITVLATHFPLLFVNQIENPDAALIYENLESLSYPFQYLKALVNFETFDFQPIRDFTFYLDIWVFNKTNFVISILFNCFIWAATCYQALKILEVELKSRISWELLLLVLCFAVYPIFEPTINWGIARKHLLSFFFIISATRSLIEWEEKKQSILPPVSYYLLSVLSVPISIAWPAWVFFRLKLFKGLRESRVRSLVLSLFLVSVVVAAINFAYYKTSFVFLNIYPQKISTLDPLIMLVNLGFQFKQILLPYNLSLFYSFDKSDLIYFGLLLAIILTLIYFIKANKQVWMWAAFALPPMVVILSTPYIYFDTYVLVSSFALFMTICTSVPTYLHRYGKLLIIPFCFWSVVTFNQHRFWNDPYAGYEKAMIVSPNCTNAQTLAARYLVGGKKLTNELYEFLQINKCLEPNASMSPGTALKTITVEAIILYGEDEIDLEYRERRLKELGSRSIYVMVFYIAFLAKSDQPEKLEALMLEQNKILQGTDVSFPFDPLYSDQIQKYCHKHALKECLTFLKRWKVKGRAEPYF